jgi:ATP-dependent RNA/DNA helicase IGHMBP2
VPDPADLDAFVALHTALLETERRAEIDSVQKLQATLPDTELERRGLTLRRLVVADLETGVGGRAHAILASSRGEALSAHRFGPGDTVALRPNGDKMAEPIGGVVVRVRSDKLIVALEDEDAELPDLLRIDRLTSDVTYRRLSAALRALQRDRSPPGLGVRQVAFGQKPPLFAAKPPDHDIAWLDQTLDASQRLAVAHALRAEHVALIHGPPGTGKTTAVVELIRQAVARGERVLACAPSNVAVDNLVERLATAAVRVVRLGHPARMLPSVVQHALDAQVEASPDRKVARDLQRDIDNKQRKLQRTDGWHARRDLRGELKRLRAELRDYETTTTRAVLDTASVVAATLTGSADGLLDGQRFDLAVIDEAAQAIEASCWIAIPRATRLVLAGDHLQLAPTIISDDAARQGLARTLFARLADGPHGAEVTRMLTVQYRMHEAIMQWSSLALYGGQITAAAAVAAHRLRDLPGVTAGPDTDCAVLLLDTAGCGLEETETADDGSKANPGEAAIVAKHVENLLAAGVATAQVGVITPYNAQVQLLRERLGRHEGLEISTVDGFQGREKEAIVLSLVRSNSDGQVGFLADARRLNVAVTRARRHVCVIGDSATLANDTFLAGLLDYCQINGEHRSAWEYRD